MFTRDGVTDMSIAVLPDPGFDDARQGDDDLFAYPGPMASQMRELDWRATPLGPVHAWPASLKTAVRILLQCQLPMYIAWGREFVQLYNDAYLPILGAKHVGALGGAAPETWHEIWHVIGPMWQEVWEGKSFGFDDFKLTIDRFGYSEDCYFNYSYSAVPDDAGNVGGVLVTFTETTQKVLSQRRQSFLLSTAHSFRELTDPFDIMRAASELLGTHLGVARAGYGEIDAAGETVSVKDDWTAPGMASLAGEQRPLASFGPAIIDVLRRGEVLRLDDIAADARAAPYAAGYASIGTQALLVVPIIRDGRFAAILYLHQPAPCQWRDEDAALARDVADQTWEAVARARVELDLRESEDHFRHTVALNPDVQWTADAHGIVDPLPPRWQEWTGEQAGDGDWMLAVHPDDRPRAAHAWAHAVLAGQPFDVQARIRLADGRHHWMHARATPRRDSAGSIVKWYGITQDIQAYRDAIDEQERHRQDFRKLAETMPNHAWVMDGAARLSWCNNEFLAYAGMGEDALHGTGWTAIVHPDDLGHALDAWRECTATGAAYDNELRLRHGGSGAYRWFIARALPAHDPVTGELRWIGTSTDVHAQKSLADSLATINHGLEEEVARRTADRDRMWRLSTDVMLVARFDATIVAVNPAWTELLGWTEQDLLGQRFLDLVHPDDVAATVAESGRLADGIKTMRFENRYRHRDGSYRWLSWTAVPDESFIHAVARDVTQEKEQRLALQHAEMALRQAQKLESIGKLTGGVAHDFNNILQVLQGSLQLLQGHVRGNEAAGQRIATALRAVERGGRLSAQLLAFARRQPLQPTVLDPRLVLESMDELLRRAVGDEIVFQVVCGTAPWPVSVDKDQLENVLLNLVINARDAMPGGGTLTLRIDNVARVDGDLASHAGSIAGEHVMFAVVDTGTGMTREVLEQACEPFFTTKPVGEGTGLGLSMAYGFVQQSGGHFRIASEPGKGTSVRLYFPRCTEAGAPVSPAAPPRCEGGSETILVVEDDPDVQATVVGILKDLGYRVVCANCAEAGLELIRNGTAVDLLFTDVIMPGAMRSPEMVRHARAILPGLAVLYTSGYAQDAIVHDGRLDPGVQLLSKPYSREQLAGRIRRMLGNGNMGR